MSASCLPGSYGHHECAFLSCEIVFKIHMISVERLIGLFVNIMLVHLNVMKAIIVVTLPDSGCIGESSRIVSRV
jgi:hypothetical protein